MELQFLRSLFLDWLKVGFRDLVKRYKRIVVQID